MNDKNNDILKQLQGIENRYQINIFFAVESGSRAWGYPSLDSDYDVRFVYHHQPHWYISAFNKRDSIDWATVRNIDLAGWDISKCVKLLHKGNASLYEWLASPIIYKQHNSKYTRLVELASKAFNQQAMFNHYFYLAKKRLHDDTRCKQAKWFLYALRELLCAKWIFDTSSPPPGNFRELLHRYLPDSALQEQLAAFLNEKAQFVKSQAPEVPALLNDFCRTLFKELEGLRMEADLSTKHLGDTEVYDQVMRDVILE